MKLTKKKQRHLDRCSAPICNLDRDEKALWYIGEQVCRYKPNAKFQKVQVALNERFRQKLIKSRSMKMCDFKTL